jgi:transposase-like protein
MGKRRSPWQDGRRAWERLNGWHQEGPSARPGHPDDGDGALTALADVCRVRHLLDQAELVAVKTARRHGKSWAEIATKLGVTRQSAWERWRDLDEATGTGPATEPAELRSEQAAEALLERARRQRRQSTVAVPNVIGMPWERARETLSDRGLVAAGPDPDGLPLAILARPGSVISDQSPESGAKVPAGSTVTLWLDRGEGGVREPRRPVPAPRAGRQLQPEPADEAVG